MHYVRLTAPNSFGLIRLAFGHERQGGDGNTVFYQLFGVCEIRFAPDCAFWGVAIMHFAGFISKARANIITVVFNVFAQLYQCFLCI